MCTIKHARICAHTCFMCTCTHMHTHVYMIIFMSRNPRADWESLPYFQILSPAGCYVEGGPCCITNVNLIPTALSLIYLILLVLENLYYVLIVNKILYISSFTYKNS